MADAAVKNKAPDAAAEAERELTDGFHLVIDALKLNGLNTIYGVPGIPITDFGRMAQAAGIRVLSFRHEQNAGYAAADRRLSHQEARRLPHGVGARLPQRPHRARPRHHQLLPDDPDLGLVRARDRRPAAGRLRGDGPARDREAALQGRVPRAARRRHRHRRGARDPRRGVGPSGWRLSRPAGQAVRPGDGCRRRREVAGQGHRRGAGADPGAERDQARARRAQGRQAAADHPRQGRRLCAGRRRDPRACREVRRAVPADEHGQGPACPTCIRNARARRARPC